MKRFEPITLDASDLSRELDELAAFLDDNATLKERTQIIPFFKRRMQLTAAIGTFHGGISLPDRVASELDLFGDFICDMASGDSATNSFLLIELENAEKDSIFVKRKSKAMTEWSRRFEHGFSQLVDWAWRLYEEGSSSVAFESIFGARHASVHMLLIAGRDARLTESDQARLKWRADNISFGAFKMSCVTFDGVLNRLRRSISMSMQPPP